ncbi:helix-turn-helix domain-containing protein [Streptomyces sp. SAS_272]|uniref:helix-turn-helix domain-containing protein n=1 Tax=Streptomyces sp. SAS_272 TaxID=3412747 RepID=UPI00403CDF77
MGRPDRPVDYTVPEFGDLAAFLRTRKATAQMTHQALAQRTGLSTATLKRAASGTVVPKLTTVVAFIQGCGAPLGEDLDHFLHEGRELWKSARHASFAPRHARRVPQPQFFGAVPEFCRGLADLHLRAGAPTVRSMEDQGGGPGVLPRSTAHRIRRASSLPADASQLRGYLIACGLPPDLHEPWIDAFERLRPQSTPGCTKTAKSSAPGRTSPRRGRPWKPVRAGTAPAQALSKYLRDCVLQTGKPLSALCEPLGYSKTQTALYLGGTVPPRQFVESLIYITVPPPARQNVHQQAMLLWNAARAASAPQPSGTVDIPRTRQVQTYRLLTQVLVQQNQLREAEANSTKLIMVLLSMVNKLEQRITDLNCEYEQLRTSSFAPDAMLQAQEQLLRAQEQEQRARQELLRAQEKQRQAEELAAVVEDQLCKLIEELDQLRDATPNDTAAQIPPASFAQPAVMVDPVGDDIEQALDRAAAVNDQDDQVLKRITYDLLSTPSANGAVRGNPEDDLLPAAVTTDGPALQPAIQATDHSGTHALVFVARKERSDRTTSRGGDGPTAATGDRRQAS